MRRSAVGMLLAVCALAGVASSATKVAAARRSAQYVVLISLDGFGAYNLDDPRASIPNLRRLAAEGARADAMTVVTPSVTWPNHTTLVTGVSAARHGVIANGVIERVGNAERMTINPRHSKQEMCRVPTLYDLAHAAGMKTAEVNWPVTRDAPTLDFRFPDHPEMIRYTTPALLDELKATGLFDPPTQAAFNAMGSVRRDEVWTGAAKHLIRRHRPNLLLLHLLNTDGTQHAHGPQSNEAFTSLALADRMVGEVLETIHQAGLRKNTAVIITADHGFIRVTKEIRVNARLKRAGLAENAYAISEGGVDYVYVPEAPRRPELLAKVREALTGLEGVAAIHEPREFAALGFPTPESNPQAPHLLLAGKEGYAFSNAADGDDVVTLPRAIGTHGYLHTEPKLDAIFLATGAGIRPKTRLGRIRNVDVAPTLASLLGLTMTNVEGQPLTAMLK